MTIRRIRTHPDPCLRKQADKVKQFDSTLHETMRDLSDTMLDRYGAGMAAPQIGVSQAIIVLNIIPLIPNWWLPLGISLPTLCMVNPVIIDYSKNTTNLIEGCISIPRTFRRVERSYRIEVSYQDKHGKSFTKKFVGGTARCVAHEIDHLHGKLLIDYEGKEGNLK